MGYTHYWEIKSNNGDAEFVRRKFKSASANVKRFAKFIEMQGMFQIRGGFGKGYPIINESEIWLNGDDSRDLGCETFTICWSDFLEDGDGFCKTGRNPYDMIVCFAILALKEAFRGEFDYSSDGDAEDWKEAIHLYESFTGKKARESVN